jgi:multidrug efflux pump subunit AcrB
MPDGVTIELVSTRAEQISGRLAMLIRNEAAGFLLVAALLFLFLNARTAFWVATGIPIALLAGLAAMWAAGSATAATAGQLTRSRTATPPATTPAAR